MNISYKNLPRRENLGSQMLIFLPFYNRNPAFKVHTYYFKTMHPWVFGSSSNSRNY